MKTHTMIPKTLIAAAGLAALAFVAGPAHAGNGSSSDAIRRAIKTNVPTIIEGELETAEQLVCGGCIEMVMELLDHSDYAVREVAGWWFARRPMQAREITERSQAHLLGNDSIKARNAADVLGAFEHPAAIPALAAAAVRTDLDAEARAAAVRALGLIAHSDANPALVSAMQDSDAGVRARAVEAWLAIRHQTDAAAVVVLVADSDVKVRRLAAGVVGSLREAAGRTALEQQLAADTDAVTRRNAAWALGRIGDSASRTALEAATADESGLVRMTARNALRQLD